MEYNEDYLLILVIAIPRGTVETDVRFKRTEKRTSTQRAKEATPIENPPRVTTNATRERGIRRNKIAPDSEKKTKKTTHDRRREDLSWEKESRIALHLDWSIG